MGGSITASLSRVCGWIAAELHGSDTEIQGVSTDSRTIVSGNLFVALIGPNHDGHEHVEAAQKRGAVAAMVDHPVDSPLPQIVVNDTRLALGQLAAAWRSELEMSLVAVTGSNGKTTVKEMVSSILATAGRVGATRGNLNNEIGVPLTLLSFSRDHQFGVVEMGANHSGEISYLSAVAQPRIAVITNAAAAHLEGFGSLEGVARAKGEIFEGLEEPGVAVINADDSFAPLWSDLAAPHPVLTFGMEQGADVRGSWQAAGRGGHLTVAWDGDEFAINLHLPGRHNGYNALAATTVALVIGISPEDITRALESMRPVSGRLQPIVGVNGSRIIDDSYNANPASIRAGLEVLAACKGRRYLAMGDMAELGNSADDLHEQVGLQALELGIDRLYSTGRMSRKAAEVFGNSGFHFDEQQSLIAALRSELAADVTLLVKGSRSSHMEQVVEALTAQVGG
jgi:UDP-N-acetylmuramoyl-tripeptide--D-alanyl-D-alanine ligase